MSLLRISVENTKNNGRGATENLLYFPEVINSYIAQTRYNFNSKNSKFATLNH